MTTQSHAKSSPAPHTIDIRPEIGVLSALQHLNYKVWYALAEFVDNSLQSAIDNAEALKALHGPAYRLQVDISVDRTPGSECITIRDNAAGIARCDYQRAFRLAAVPPNRAGLSEFGMGLKTAACWLADSWEVRTSALDEPFEGRVGFDVPAILAAGEESLVVKQAHANANAHFTEVTLRDLRHELSGGRTIGKIREHLGDIYRCFLRSGFLELTFDGHVIEFQEPEALVAPPFDQPDTDPIRWEREVDVQVTPTIRLRGKLGLFARASTKRAGFALMRRDRLIQGLSEETWRPSDLFGSSNSFVYQRLYGELSLEGVAISHTKDSFVLEPIEAQLIEKLGEVLNDPSLPLLRQAQGYRARVAKEPGRMDIAVGAASGTVDEIARHPEVCAPSADAGTDASSGAAAPPTVEGASPTRTSRTESRTFEVDNEPWTVTIELRDDESIGDWLTVSEQQADKGRQITLVFALSHPFVQRFAQPDSSELEPLIRLACAIGIAEVMARHSGVRMAGSFRRHINRLLRDAMAAP